MLTIHPIRAFTDNYIWIIHDQSHAAIVDPGTASPVIDYLRHRKLQVIAILVTHHHADHTSGISDLLQSFDIPVYGPGKEDIPHVTSPLEEGDHIRLNELALSLTILETPGHTKGHIAYYAVHPAHMVFCGDTLFSCGCGKMFEGTPQQFYHSLQKLARLPDDTLVYCTHEYTQNNIRFAQVADPNNADLLSLEKKVHERRSHERPTLPTTIMLEKKVNPFLRCDQPPIIHSVQNHFSVPVSDPVEVFRLLREWKNNF